MKCVVGASSMHADLNVITLESTNLKTVRLVGSYITAKVLSVWAKNNRYSNPRCVNCTDND